ncbi:MAG: phosphodiesterase [Aquabacterium sp.]|jgi:Icc protein|nr:MAG: phosphodiesterase [Aquabacterium sp.]
MLIAQLSDIHIRPPGVLYQGVADSNAMFAEAIAHLHALDRRPDLVLITGDLTDEGRPEEYAQLRVLLSQLRLPYVVMPGNHDERGNLRAAFADQAHLPASGPLHACIDDHPVRLVLLDSCPPGEHHGRIDEAGLQWLRRTLDADPRKPTIVALHHPPFVSGIPYMDEYRCFDAEALGAVLSGYDNIEAVLCGHVHRPIVRRWAGTVVIACPSTATEIALRLDPQAQPASWMGPRACMLHLWDEAQGLVSHTSYIGSYPGPYPFF